MSVSMKNVRIFCLLRLVVLFLDLIKPLLSIRDQCVTNPSICQQPSIKVVKNIHSPKVGNILT